MKTKAKTTVLPTLPLLSLVLSHNDRRREEEKERQRPQQ